MKRYLIMYVFGCVTGYAYAVYRQYRKQCRAMRILKKDKFDDL